MNLGKIYCINRNDRPDRWASVQQEFERVGIKNVQRFSAFTGGWKGCAQSHLAIIDANKNEPRFTIFEDDVRFLHNPLEILAKAESQLPAEWDMLYLGANPQAPMEKFSDNLFRLRKAWCAHAIIFNNRPRKVIDFITRHRASIKKIDVFYSDTIQEAYGEFGVFITNPLVASQENNFSDITNTQNTYYDTIINGYEKHIPR